MKRQRKKAKEEKGKKLYRYKKEVGRRGKDKKRQ